VVLNDARAIERPARAPTFSRLLKPIVFVVSCLPLAKLAADAFADKLTANPIAEVLNRLGFWTLTFLVASLAISPMKTLFGFTSAARVRRMVGLFAFFYATLHFATYLGLDQAFDLRDIGEDIVKRKFIAVGVAAFALLLPLALTSTDRAVKRLGFRRWKRLHFLVYPAALLAIIHFIWRVKIDLLRPGIFAAILGALFALRIGAAVRARTLHRVRVKRTA
jgi:sulfoxide reductase heme-binding subunit YedZ